MKSYFIGVDGGATKSIVRLEDDAGNVLGQFISGPANIRLSVDQAYHSITYGIQQLLQQLSLPADQADHRFYMGLGVAGCELTEAYTEFHQRFSETHPAVVISSDSHVACLGAHVGKDGAIVIVGTGVVGFQKIHNQVTKVSGWGFPHDDQGSGAWLGLEAVKITLQTIDGRMPVSHLAQAILKHFDNNTEYFVNWANKANATAFGELAPHVVQQSAAGDVMAQNLLHQAANAIEKVMHAMQAAQTSHHVALPWALVGSLAPYIKPFLNESLQSRLSNCELPPEAGAILLARQTFLDK